MPKYVRLASRCQPVTGRFVRRAGRFIRLTGRFVQRTGRCVPAKPYKRRASSRVGHSGSDHYTVHIYKKIIRGHFFGGAANACKQITWIFHTEVDGALKIGTADVVNAILKC